MAWKYEVTVTVLYTGEILEQMFDDYDLACAYVEGMIHRICINDTPFRLDFKNMMNNDTILMYLSLKHAIYTEGKTATMKDGIEEPYFDYDFDKYDGFKLKGWEL